MHFNSLHKSIFQAIARGSFLKYKLEDVRFQGCQGLPPHPGFPERNAEGEELWTGPVQCISMAGLGHSFKSLTDSTNIITWLLLIKFS